MAEYPIDPSVRDMWKSFPLRIQGGSKASCCGAPTLLVQSMDGGYVTRNCSEHGDKNYWSLPEHVFMHELDLWVACPNCKRRMSPGRVPHSNYGYVCGTCDLSIKLSSLLPRWADLV